MQNENERPVTVSEKINEFVQKHRKPLFVSVATILVILIVCVGALSLMDALQGRANEAVEQLASRYETLRPSIIDLLADDTENVAAEPAFEAPSAESAAEETVATESAEAVPVTDEVAAFMDELETFAKRHSGLAAGYAGGRAWSILASIYGDRKDWEQAEAAWAAAAKTAKKTFLAPLALFNAGVAAEEQGKVAQAIEYYSASLSADADFPAAPRAQFAIGRLQESLGETGAAIEAYRAVISGWSYDKVWTNLAQSRIIALETDPSVSE